MGAKLLKTIIIVTLPFFIVLGTVRILVTDSYLAFEYGKADFPLDPFGLSEAERLNIALANFRFVRECQPLESLGSQRLAGNPLYNQRELNHMQDVQTVYQKSGQVWFVAIILIVLACIGLGRKQDTHLMLASALFSSGLLTAGLIALAGMLALFAWRSWFLLFHQAFFAAGTWTFNNSDTLIRLFPEKFWFDAALTISGLVFLEGMLLALGSRLWLSRIRIASMKP